MVVRALWGRVESQKPLEAALYGFFRIAGLAKRPFRRFADFDAANFKLQKTGYLIVSPKDLICILQIKGPRRTGCLYSR